VKCLAVVPTGRRTRTGQPIYKAAPSPRPVYSPVRKKWEQPGLARRRDIEAGITPTAEVKEKVQKEAVAAKVEEAPPDKETIQEYVSVAERLKQAEIRPGVYEKREPVLVGTTPSQAAFVRAGGRLEYGRGVGGRPVITGVKKAPPGWKKVVDKDTGEVSYIPPTPKEGVGVGRAVGVGVFGKVTPIPEKYRPRVEEEARIYREARVPPPMPSPMTLYRKHEEFVSAKITPVARKISEKIGISPEDVGGFAGRVAAKLPIPKAQEFTEAAVTETIRAPFRHPIKTTAFVGLSLFGGRILRGVGAVIKVSKVGKYLAKAPKWTKVSAGIAGKYGLPALYATSIGIGIAGKPTAAEKGAYFGGVVGTEIAPFAAGAIIRKQAPVAIAAYKRFRFARRIRTLDKRLVSPEWKFTAETERVFVPTEKGRLGFETELMVRRPPGIDVTPLAPRERQLRLKELIKKPETLTGRPGVYKKGRVIRDIERYKKRLAKFPEVTDPLTGEKIAPYIPEKHLALGRMIGQRRLTEFGAETPLTAPQARLVREYGFGIRRIPGISYKLKEFAPEFERPSRIGISYVSPELLPDKRGFIKRVLPKIPTIRGKKGAFYGGLEFEKPTRFFERYDRKPLRPGKALLEEPSIMRAKPVPIAEFKPPKIGVTTLLGVGTLSLAKPALGKKIVPLGAGRELTGFAPPITKAAQVPGLKLGTIQELDLIRVQRFKLREPELLVPELAPPGRVPPERSPPFIPHFPRVPRPPKIPGELFPPLPGGGLGRRRKIKKRKGKQPKRYTPSLTAVVLGIRGKPSKIGELTGLGIRPLPSLSVKKKRKKKRR